MPILAKVTGDLEAPRGPDIALTIGVPPRWLGREVEFTLPRNAHCAACGGGGCDRCGRSGAIATRARDAEAEVVRLVLPAEGEGDNGANSRLVLRIPERGGAAEQEGLPRGHLLVEVVVSDAPAELGGAVLASLAPPLASDRLAERRELMKRSSVLVIVMILLFFGMLRISGWL